MREQLHLLYALQKIDARIAAINSRLAVMDGARELKKAYAAAKGSLAQSEAVLEKQESEVMDMELKLKTIDEKRVKFEQKLYSGAITNPKELSAVEKEVAILKEQQGKLDTQVLALYDAVEAARNAAGEAREALKNAEAEARAALAREAAERKQLESELADLNAKRAQAASKVTDPALLSRYDMVRRKTGCTGAARVVDNRCEACHVAVTPFVTRKLSQDNELVTCESCGRILMADFAEPDE